MTISGGEKFEFSTKGAKRNGKAEPEKIVGGFNNKSS